MGSELAGYIDEEHRLIKISLENSSKLYQNLLTTYKNLNKPYKLHFTYVIKDKNVTTLGSTIKISIYIIYLAYKNNK